MLIIQSSLRFAVITDINTDMREEVFFHYYQSDRNMEDFKWEQRNKLYI